MGKKRNRPRLTKKDKKTIWGLKDEGQMINGAHFRMKKKRQLQISFDTDLKNMMN